MNNEQHLTNFKRKLAYVGLKVTNQRKLIFLTLLENAPLTTPEIADLANGKVDRATVYRIVELFEEIRLVNRIWDGWKSKLELSDAFIAHHHHATCSGCGKGFRIESNKLEDVLQSIAQDIQFTMDSHTVELYGLCRGCTANE